MADHFEQFRDLVLADASLRDTLQRAETWAAFVPAALAAAAERGLSLAPDDLERAREEARRSWFERWI